MKRWIATALLGVVCATQVSCSESSTDNRNQLLGGLGGAALGAGIGALATGGDTKAIIAGAAAGAVAGWAAVKLVQYQSEKTASAKEEAKAYGYRSADGTVVKMRGAKAQPATVSAGDRVTLNTDYAVLAPQGTENVPVRELWTLEKDGKQLAQVPPKEQTRAPGGWHSKAGIDVPSKAEKGTYVVRSRVEAGDSYDEREASFTVR